MPLGNGRVAEHSCAIRREPLPALRLVRRHRQNIDSRSGLRIVTFISQNAIKRITISRARFTCGSFFRTRHCANNASSFNTPSRSRTRFACSSVFRVRLRATAGIINAMHRTPSSFSTRRLTPPQQLINVFRRRVHAFNARRAFAAEVRIAPTAPAVVDLSSLGGGTYTIELRYEGGSLTRSIVKL